MKKLKQFWQESRITLSWKQLVVLWADITSNVSRVSFLPGKSIQTSSLTMRRKCFPHVMCFFSSKYIILKISRNIFVNLPRAKLEKFFHKLGNWRRKSDRYSDNDGDKNFKYNILNSRLRFIDACWRFAYFFLRGERGGGSVSSLLRYPTGLESSKNTCYLWITASRFYCSLSLVHTDNQLIYST
jgi:hypothetical protein